MERRKWLCGLTMYAAMGLEQPTLRPKGRKEMLNKRKGSKIHLRKEFTNFSPEVKFW
jgi:hypothetical protein